MARQAVHWINRVVVIFYVNRMFAFSLALPRLPFPALYFIVFVAAYVSLVRTHLLCR